MTKSNLHQELVREQAGKICETYKISQDEVSNILVSKIEDYPKLKKLIADANNLKSVYRTREFKDFIKKIRKEIYFQLRTYKKVSDSITDSHISTRERAPYLQDFFKQIDGYLQGAETILDLGGGLFPASFPFDIYPKLKKYVWVDKNKDAYEILKKHPHNKLILHNYPLNKNNWEYYLPNGKKEFDLVFMLKLIPVLHRQERHLLEFLSTVPAKLVLITGSKEAMVKKQDIFKRENAVITKFIDNHQKEIIKKIDLPNEFGYLIE